MTLFSIRTPISDDAVVLSWEAPGTQKDLRLFRSADSVSLWRSEELYREPVFWKILRRSPGWNYYLLKDSAVAMGSKVFLEGISVAILPQSETDYLVLHVGNFSRERNGKYRVFGIGETSGQAYNLALKQGQNVVTVDAGH